MSDEAGQTDGTGRPDRTDELLWRHVAGELEAGEEEVIRRLLAGDPERARDLFQLAEEHFALKEMLGSRPPKRRARRIVRRATRGPKLTWLLPLAAAAAAAVVLVWPRPGRKVEAVASLTVTSGEEVRLRRGAANWTPAREGSKLFPGDGVRTQRARARIDFRHGHVVFVNHSTSLTVLENAAGTGVSMSGGETYVETASPSSGFRVETPHAHARAKGTRFGVETGPAGTTVAVAKGSVAVSTETAEAVVEAGHEVLVSRWAGPPGPVREAPDVNDRFAWADGLGRTVVAQKRSTQEAVTQETITREAVTREAVAREATAQEGVTRARRGLVALYRFDEGEGSTVHDVSAVGEPLDLEVPRAEGRSIAWIPGGLRIVSPTALRSVRPAKKIALACMSTGELTIEAWIRPGNLTQSGPARIVTLSLDRWNRDFTLGQGLIDALPTTYVVRVRTTETDANGMPGLTTAGGAVRTRKTHVVYTRDASGTSRFYIDGVRARVVQAAYGEGQIVWSKPPVRGALTNWDVGYHLMLGNEVAGGKAWLGDYYLVAVYGRALAAEEVVRNHEAGAD